MAVELAVSRRPRVAGEWEAGQQVLAVQAGALERVLVPVLLVAALLVPMLLAGRVP